MPIANTISIEESGGVSFLLIDNPLCSAKISLYGGHLLSYVPKSDGRERLWLSPMAYLNGERPIRGGVPVCWPWFSDNHGKQKGELPSHGYLRTQTWKVTESDESEKGTRVVLSPTFTRGTGFEYDCSVQLEFVLGDVCSITLRTSNTGVVAFTFNCALHTYFNVPNIDKASLLGLTGDYKDKTDNWAVKPTPSPYRFSGETDRIHLSPCPRVSILDNDEFLTDVESRGHDSIVVWNPWHGAASIGDMDAFGYKHMVCVETAYTGGKELQPGETHSLTQIIG
ncbi:D-hexose-6-phosphate mutarotase [Alteromonas aestuariivivens]|uniref:Putative glucose-6-phosphate 1-epimerase n=1 Tax=Alteromonas aestuariivivens TaxID=1938339 RepID=A0A3D8M8U2_9ALTE|nr:D-hexose-6-phosphate mutarotase [Alteromonas aestuariivivens]RDV26152.1 D-hexose-6-phosphate mutarotase [Alteromonas aestuariivivens]